MRDDRISPLSAQNADCPAESVKSALGGASAVPARGIRRGVLFVSGIVSLATGVIGMFVPVLPTTCFLLLAAWCFGKSSPRLQQWMFHNRWFGSYLKDYREGRGIPRAVKIGSLSMLWIGIGASVVFVVGTLWVRILLVAIAAAVTLHIVTLKTPARPREA